jgi:hypothetical protein
MAEQLQGKAKGKRQKAKVLIGFSPFRIASLV